MKMDRATLRALALASQLGLSIAVSVGLGVLGGLWVDDRLRTGPIFLLLGTIVGLLSAGYIIRDLAAFERNSDDEEDNDHRSY